MRIPRPCPCTQADGLRGVRYRVNDISREMLTKKLAEAKKLREAGETDLDSGKIDILSLLAKASLDERSPYRMDQKLLEAQVSALSVSAVQR